MSVSSVAASGYEGENFGKADQLLFWRGRAIAVLFAVSLRVSALFSLAKACLVVFAYTLSVSPAYLRGHTLVNLAVRQGAFSVVESLAKINSRWIRAESNKGCNPLFLAIDLGMVDVAKTLIECGASVEQRHKGESPLLCAVHTGNLSMVEMLVGSFQADVNGVSEKIRSWQGKCCTPLMGARSLEVAKYLVSRGARINDRDSRGWTPISYAASRNCRMVFFYLLNQPDIDLGGEASCLDAALLGIMQRLFFHKGSNLDEFKRFIEEFMTGDLTDFNGKIHGYMSLIHFLYHVKGMRLCSLLGQEIEAENSSKVSYEAILQILLDIPTVIPTHQI